mgnify:CR=1 FL=1
MGIFLYTCYPGKFFFTCIKINKVISIFFGTVVKYIKVIVDIINASSGMNNTTKNKFRQHMLSGTFGAGFVTGLMAKDVRTALEVVETTGTSSLLAKPCTEIWNKMEQDLGFTSDHTEMFRYVEAGMKK